MSKNQAILEIELIINNQLYENGIINKIQYDEVNKTIYNKINNLKSNNR